MGGSARPADETDRDAHRPRPEISRVALPSDPRRRWTAPHSRTGSAPINYLFLHEMQHKEGATATAETLCPSQTVQSRQRPCWHSDTRWMMPCLRTTHFTAKWWSGGRDLWLVRAGSSKLRCHLRTTLCRLGYLLSVTTLTLSERLRGVCARYPGFYRCDLALFEHCIVLSLVTSRHRVGSTG